MVDRRSYIKTGVAFVGTALSIGGRSPSPQRSRANQFIVEELPEDAKTTIVNPLSEEYVLPQLASTEDWIIHRFGWKTVADEDASDLRDILDITTHTFAIDGLDIEAPDQYRGEIYQTTDGVHHVGWEFPTKPRHVGVHDFTMKIEFESPIRTEHSEHDTKVWQGTYEHHGTYEVVDLEKNLAMG